MIAASEKFLARDKTGRFLLATQDESFKCGFVLATGHVMAALTKAFGNAGIPELLMNISEITKALKRCGRPLVCMMYACCMWTNACMLLCDC